MSAVQILAAARRIRTHLRRTADRLGLPGVVGVALLVGSVGFYAGTVRPLLEQTQDAPGVVLPTIRTVGPTPADASSDRLRAFTASFPDETEVARLLAQLYALGESSGVRLAHGEYRFTEADALGLVQYRLVLPVGGSYPQVRRFVGAVLESVPAAAITQVALQRERVGAGQIEARIELTLHLRAGGARVVQDVTPQHLSAAPGGTQ